MFPEGDPIIIEERRYIDRNTVVAQWNQCLGEVKLEAAMTLWQNQVLQFAEQELDFVEATDNERSRGMLFKLKLSKG